MREIWSNLFIVLSLSLALAAPVPAAAQTPATPAPAPTAPKSSSAGILAIGPDDRVLGSPGAPITIVEYASLTCPHCAHFEADVLPKLREKWIDTGKAKLVLRDYPLDQPALDAAVVARCAPADRFYGFVEALFAQQQKWEMAKDYKAALARIAELGGISKGQLATCLANKDLEQQVLQSRLTASQELGVDSTPSFFINGTKFEGAPTLEQFEAVLSRLAGS